MDRAGALEGGRGAENASGDGDAALIGGDCAEFGVQDAGRVFAAGVARRRAALRGPWLGAV